MEPRKNEATWSDKYKRWTIKVQRDGERKPFYSSRPGKKGKLEAERKADAWLAQGCYNANIRFGELAKRYLDSLDTGNGHAHKVKEASIIRCWLTPRWEHKKVATLTNHEYQLAVNAPAERTPPLSKRTCGHISATITAIWGYAQTERIIMERPFKLKIPKAATVKPKTILQPGEIKRLFNKEFDRYFYIDLFRFVVITGLRRGELCGLQWSDIDGKTLTIARAINSLKEETTGKNENARRTIILPDIAVDILAAQAARMKAKSMISPYVFPNTKGKRQRADGTYDRWIYFRDKHNFAAASLHELRHTMISIMKAELPLPLLKQVVGHSEDMDTLGTYGQAVDGEAERSSAIINAAYAKILGVG